MTATKYDKTVRPNFGSGEKRRRLTGYHICINYTRKKFRETNKMTMTRKSRRRYKKYSSFQLISLHSQSLGLGGERGGEGTDLGLGQSNPFSVKFCILFKEF